MLLWTYLGAYIAFQYVVTFSYDLISYDKELEANAHDYQNSCCRYNVTIEGAKNNYSLARQGYSSTTLHVSMGLIEADDRTLSNILQLI